MDKNKLKAKMLLYGDNGDTLSKYLSISRTTLSNKMNDVSEFTQKEIIKIKERYSLTAEETDEIFFTEKVSKEDTK